MLSLPRSWLLSFSIVAGCCTAQTTWIVDANGGSGSHFTEIQPAVDAASVGDVILIFPGRYGNVFVSRGVTIRGVTPGTVTSPFVGVGPILQDHRLILSDLIVTQLSIGGGIGTIAVARVRGNELIISDSASVHVTNCSFQSTGQRRSFPTASVFRSNVSFTNCTFFGAMLPPRP